VNYLAHAYLSFGIPEIVVGNLISDFVKGKKQFDYPDRIRTGITLHRAIDTYTDTHPVTRQAKSYFRSAYGLYSGALIDVAYDHFLANDPLSFPPTGGHGQLTGGHGQPLAPAAFGREDHPALAAFAQLTYQQLAAREAVFPERFARIFPYMRDQNWLYHYRFKEGIFRSFAGLSRRAAYMAGPEQACRLFEAHYAELEACYREFFPALTAFAGQELERLLAAGPSLERLVVDRRAIERLESDKRAQEPPESDRGTGKIG
jgi:acyl carrier protein phosphodiesterase